MEGLTPGLSRRKGARGRSQNQCAGGSYRPRLDPNAVRINPRGPPYLERVDPDAVGQRCCEQVLQFGVPPGRFVITTVGCESHRIGVLDDSGNCVVFLPQFLFPPTPAPDALAIPRPHIQHVSRARVGVGIDRDGGDVNLDAALPQYRPDVFVRLAPMPHFSGGVVPRIDVDEGADRPGRDGAAPR